jgi:corrinoid protein of di/trimethylamine methyltransferase
MCSDEVTKNVLEELFDAIVRGDEIASKTLAKTAVEMKIDPLQIVDDSCSAAMNLVGEKFAKFEVFLSEMMLAAEAMKAAMEVLRPIINAGEKTEIRKGSILIGTVQGDIHDIGKDFVVALLESAGYEIHDIGVDVPTQRFIEEAERLNPDIIALSALLSTTRLYQRDVIETLRDMGLREKYRIIVGGGSVTPTWAKEISADGYGRTAKNAVELVDLLTKKNERSEQPLIVEDELTND